jgi:hypothetical protein
MRKPLHVEDPAKGRLFAGYTDGKTFYRDVDPSRHLLRKHNGYAIQDSVLNELVDRGVETVVLQEPNRRLVSNLEDWQDYGKPIDLGHGEQTVLPVTYMSVN